MKIVYLAVIASFLSYSLSGQLYHPMDSIINKPDISSFLIADTLKIEVYKKNQKEYTLFINDNPIDVLKQFNKMPLVYNRRIFFNYNTENDCKIYYYEGKIDSFQVTFEVDNGLLQYFTYDYLKENIYIVNPITGSKKLFKHFEFDDSEKTITQIFFIDFNSVFVEVCTYEGESCGKYNFYQVSPSGMIEITEKIMFPWSKKEYQMQFFKIHFMSNDKKYLLTNNRFSGQTSNMDKTITRILTNNFDEVGYALTIRTDFLRGYNVQKGVIQNYFLTSYIDVENPINRTLIFVLVSYKFNPELESSMYKAYNNILLTPKDITGFGKYELGILRNLIFAKYNYGFGSEFYQAYFNLYEFYCSSDKRKSRKNMDDVSRLLTDIDKANVKMIQDADIKTIKNENVLEEPIPIF